MWKKAKQHLIPCAYLKFFSNDRWIKSGRKCKVLFFDKRKGKTELRNAESVFHTRNFYTLYTWWVRNIEVENLLWKIEDLYPKIYEKLVKDKKISEEEHSLLMLYIWIQLFRTKKWESLILEWLLWEPKYEELSKEEKKQILRTSIFTLAKEIGEILGQDFIFCLYKAVEWTSFLTSDTPVFWRVLWEEPLDPGWYEPFELIFPLSSEYLLLWFHKNSNSFNKVKNKNAQFIECNNIDEDFMNRVNAQIWFHAQEWIVSKNQKELDNLKAYKFEENTSWKKPDRKIWKVVFKRK